VSLENLVKSIQDIMRKDAGVDGDAQRISQMVWLLFLKILDDREKEWELDKNYKSPVPHTFRWRNWASDPEGMTGGELLGFVNNILFPGLKALATSTVADKRARVVGSIFEDGYNYMKNGTLLRQVINKIQADIDYNSKSERHLLGEIYEKILRDLQSAGNAGEYYTPRAVTEFMVQMVDPQLDDIVLDPACGTGGFLTCTIDHKRDPKRGQVRTPAQERTLQMTLRGVEKKPLPHMLATTNMLLHGINDPSFIKRDNMLARPLRDYGIKDEVDCILTNPPFGGMEEDGVESNFPQPYRTRETADLFLALIVKLLKPGGRAGVVLPDSSLSGSEGVKLRIKEHLLQACNLHTIVRLPNGVFNPYTGIKTNLLFFTKGEPTKSVWFYEHPYPPGVKNYNKTVPIDIAEFEAEKAWWCKDTPAGRSHRKDTQFAWQVSLGDIKKNNFNLDAKNPNAEEIKHGDPDVLLGAYKGLLNELAAARNALSEEIDRTLKDGRP
jgi:type I restriction enzyme M protein